MLQVVLVREGRVQAKRGGKGYNPETCADARAGEFRSF